MSHRRAAWASEVTAVQTVDHASSDHCRHDQHGPDECLHGGTFSTAVHQSERAAPTRGVGDFEAGAASIGAWGHQWTLLTLRRCPSRGPHPSRGWPLVRRTPTVGPVMGVGARQISVGGSLRCALHPQSTVLGIRPPILGAFSGGRFCVPVRRSGDRGWTPSRPYSH